MKMDSKKQMISKDDAPYTYEYDNYFKLVPAINQWSSDEKRINGGILVDPGFSYSSDLNSEWMTKDELNEWIKLNNSRIGSY